MIRQEVYEITSSGFIKERYLGVLENGKLLSPDNLDLITVKLPQSPPLFKPKWNGDNWIEGETKEEKAEREAQQLLESIKPSPTEIADAELEIKLITILTELGVT